MSVPLIFYKFSVATLIFLSSRGRRGKGGGGLKSFFFRGDKVQSSSIREVWILNGMSQLGSLY